MLSSLTNCVHELIIGGNIYCLKMMQLLKIEWSTFVWLHVDYRELSYCTYKRFTANICSNCLAIIYFTLNVCIYFVNVSWCC